MRPVVRIEVFGDGHVEHTEHCAHRHPPEIPSAPCTEANEKADVIYEGDPSAMGEGYATVERDRKELAKGKALGPIKSTRDVYDLVYDQLSKESQEVFLVIPLDLHGEPISRPVEVARGQRDRVTIDPSDVLRPAIATNAAGFIIVHNHPSTHARPSHADRKLTTQIRKSTEIALPTVVFIDHVVIGTNGKRGQYFSLSENKLYKA